MCTVHGTHNGMVLFTVNVHENSKLLCTFVDSRVTNLVLAICHLQPDLILH